jgi:ABC-type phosphate transport system substrate-binding protein
VNALIAKYDQTHAGIVIKYTADGGNAGIQDVQDGASEFAIQTAAPSLAADGGTTFNKLFADAVIIAVNSKNKVSSASFKTIKNIFTGLDTKWSQVAGSKTGGVIDPYGRASTAGLYTIMYKAILSPSDQSPSVSQQTSDGEVALSVKGNKQGIGYLGLASSHQSGIKALSLSTGKGKPVAPNNANIKKFLSSGGKSGYPLAHYDYGVLPTSNANPAAAAFLKWIQTSSVAAGIINETGGISL